MTDYVIAHCNVARALADIEDPIMQGFVDRLDPLHDLADNHPGFVWRYDPPDDDDTVVRVFEDPRILFNLSVWDTVETLATYVYRTDHVEAIRKRAEWFEPFGSVSMVMWWLEKGQLPSVEDAKAKLAELDANGPTPSAFTFKNRFPPPE